MYNMATAFDHIVSAPARHKRKGIPMRSPCQRDMVEAPGVVFRFPDKINTGLNILPSSAGLPSGHGAKSAAAVIAAAAAVSASSSPSSETSNINASNPSSQSHPPVLSATSIPATTVELPATTITSTKTTSQVINPEGLLLDSSATSTTSATAAMPILPSVEISSTTSTPILKPASALPIHRSASNVLHYPELLSDLRDKLMQVHQGANSANNASSGVESDENHTVSHHAIKRSRVKRASRSVVGSGSSPAPSGSGHGTRGSSVLRTTLRSRHELGAAAAAATAAANDASATGALAVSVSASSSAAQSNGNAAGTNFHRRHSIGTIHSQQAGGDDSDIVVDDDDDDEVRSNASNAKAVSSSAKSRYSPGRRLPRDGQVAAAAAAARRHLPKGSGEADAGAPRASPSAKRKRDTKDGNLADHHRGGSPAVKRPAVGHHANQQPQHAHSHAPGGGAVKELVGSPFAGASSRRCCASCGASSTPCWRPGLIDSMTLCNQCGLRYKKGKVYCVKCSYVPTKTEIATGGATVCKRCLSHIRTLPSAATHNVVIMQPSRIPPSGSAGTTPAHSDSRRVILPAPHSPQQQQEQQHQKKPAQSSSSRPGL